MAKEGEPPPIELRLQQAMPDMLMRVGGVRESFGLIFQVVRDRVEQSLEAANSIDSPFRGIISGRVPFVMNTGIVIHNCTLQKGIPPCS